MTVAPKLWLTYPIALAILFVFHGAGHAQHREKIPRLGFLGFNDPSVSKEHVEAFRSGLRELGYLEKQTIDIDYRWAHGKSERLPKLAAEIVGLKPDVIFAAAAPSIKAVKETTKTIPIVFEMLADPVSAGFVDSFAQPGGNLTGIAGLAPELSGKRLELLKEIVPKLHSVNLLANPANPNFLSIAKESEKAAGALGLRFETIEVREPAGLRPAFTRMIKNGSDAVSVAPDSMLLAERKTIADLAIHHGLPAVYGTSGVAEIGGLMTYSPSQREMWRRAATYVDKILKGAKPTELPVEQPTKFEFIVNLRTAKQIGLIIPPNVLARADKVFR